jgi:glycosyltransferase involved in cell wall biosynthesis
MQNNEGIKVSLIVAIYKSENFLDKLIISIINQTHHNLEIILVDDGSPDGSGKICDNYAEEDNRIIVLHKPNGGTCEARNRGMEMATGEYLMIIDGDDWLALDCVEYLLNVAIQTGSDMALSDKLFTTRDQVQTTNDFIELWSAEEAAAKIIYPHMRIGPWNKIYKTTMLRESNITFSVPWSGEGLYFTAMAAQHSNHVGVGHKKVYNYRLNNVESGLTKHNVVIGINALNNIKYIGETLVIRTPKLVNAVNWHIWKNYNFLLKLIVATNSKNKYSNEYKECLKKSRTMLPSVLVKSEVSFKEKLRMIYMGAFPVFYAKRSIRNLNRGLEKDKTE